MDPLAIVVLLITGAVVAAIALFAKREPRSESTAAPMKTGALSTAPSVNQQQAVAVITLLIMGGLVWFYFFGGVEQQAARSMDKVYTNVAADFGAQYDIAKRSGSAMDACLAAGLAAAGALQAKDEGAYRRWKATETADCQRAGVPR